MRLSVWHAIRLTTAAALLVVAAAGCARGEVAGEQDGADAGGSPGTERRIIPSWQEQAAAIEGIVNFHAERPELLAQDHQSGPLDYEVVPPVGGVHNDVWMNCQGDVYSEPIPNEHAVHSLEHGAIWVTYRPDLPDEQVAALAQRIQSNDYQFLSPFPGLDAPISLQAWGYQLKVDDAADPRIDEFIQVLRRNASPEGRGAPCGGGTTVTGTVPQS